MFAEKEFSHYASTNSGFKLYHLYWSFEKLRNLNSINRFENLFGSNSWLGQNANRKEILKRCKVTNSMSTADRICNQALINICGAMEIAHSNINITIIDNFMNKHI